MKTKRFQNVFIICCKGIYYNKNKKLRVHQINFWCTLFFTIFLLYTYHLFHAQTNIKASHIPRQSCTVSPIWNNPHSVLSVLVSLLYSYILIMHLLTCLSNSVIVISLYILRRDTMCQMMECILVSLSL